MNILAVIASFSDRKKPPTFAQIQYFYLYLAYSGCGITMDQTAKKTDKYRAQQ